MTTTRTTTRATTRAGLLLLAALTLTGCGTATPAAGTQVAATVSATLETQPDTRPDTQRTAQAPRTKTTGTKPRATRVATRRTTTFKGTTTAALKTLPVRPEVTTGYDRDLYNHWTSQGNGCDTRDTVFIAEDTDGNKNVGPDCTYTGRWYSYYDKQYTTDPSTYDLDHLVALGQAHASGANTWNASTRERFANDLGDPRSLVAVTASTNRSKSDRDPSTWQPAYGKCRYIAEWVAVKVRWSLAVNEAERRAIVSRINACPTKTITVTRARIYKDTATTDPGAGTPDNNSTGLTLTTITYDPPGTDGPDNLNNELVAITNPTTNPINLTGWTLTDAASATYTFTTGTLNPGATIRVHSGTGTTTATDTYAGYGNVWNNTGDTATLTQPNGTVADTCTYTATSTGTHTC